MVYTFFGSFASCVVLLALVMGCAKGSDIPITNPAKPAGPTSDNSGGPTSSPKNPHDPSDPGNPVDPGGPVTPPSTRYRVFCDDRYPPYLMAISSLASSTGFGSGFDVSEDPSAGKRAPAVDPLTVHNLENQQSPQVVALPKFGSARVLFSASRVSNSTTFPNSARFLFISDVDLTKRAGLAKFLASEIQPAGAVVSMALKESLNLKTFGTSDKGKYLLIGQDNGYRVLESASLKSLGVLKVGSASTNVNPFLRESDMMFSVSLADGGGITSKLYSVARLPSGDMKSIALVATVPSLRRPVASLGPNPGESFAAIDTQNRVAVVSPLKKSPGVTRSAIDNLPSKGRLASSAAFWRDAKSNAVRAAIVFENVTALSSGISRRYKIEQVFVRALDVDETKFRAMAIGADYDYPSESRTTIEMGIGSQMFPGVSDFRSSPDGEAVFGLFPGSLSMQLYRLTSSGLVRVSQESCTRFSIGVEL